MEEVMARGPNFVYAKEFIKQKYGDPIWKDILSQLPAQAGDVWNAPHLLTEEYPFSAFLAMISALSQVVGGLTTEQTIQLYEYIADRSLNTVYKVFFRFAHPAFVLKNYPKLWKRFFAVGAVEVPSAHTGYAMLTFKLPEIFLDWLPPACYGYSKKAVEMAGGRDLSIQEVHRLQTNNGDWDISYELFWKE